MPLWAGQISIAVTKLAPHRDRRYYRSLSTKFLAMCSFHVRLIARIEILSNLHMQI